MRDGRLSSCQKRFADRWYHTNGVSPAFCFGHGLSFTSWGYSALEATRTRVSFIVRNTGEVGGSEVVQLYLTFPPSAHEPPRQLKGFKKVTLEPAQSATVTLPLSPRDFSIWDERRHAWAVAPGTFELAVGASSCDLRVKASVVVE